MTSRSRTGVAAILAGALYFAGQGGELVFDEPEPLWGALGIGGFIAFAVAIWGLRDLVGATRRGRIGIRFALAGVGFLLLFAVQLVVELIRSGDIPDNFLLFAVGFLLVLIGQLLFARDLRPSVGPAWVLPIVGIVGLIVALTLDVDPIHDIGLFVFEGAWIALGVALYRSEPRAETAPAVA